MTRQGPTTAAHRVDASDLSASVVLLWTIVVFFYGAGDLFTTTVGVLGAGTSEAGPIMATVVENFGVFGMVPVKLAVLAVAFVAWRLVPEPESIAVPAGFAVTGVLVTAWNASLLL